MNATPTNTLSSPLPLPASNGPSRPRPAHSASPVVPPLVFANNATPTSGATPPSDQVRNQQNSENSDRNNNATPPTTPTRGLSIPPVGPPPLAVPNARRPSHQRCSPPVGARPTKQDLPPGAAPLGSIPRPPQPPSSNSSSQGISVPLLASQLGRPVNLGERGQQGQTPPGGPGGPGGLLGPGMPPLSPHHLNLLAHTLSPFAAIPMGNGKFMARNINGTLAVTSHPSNESELQIYRVLQRANLLTYYDTFIAQGGDDVQQLCEAGEAEFLEIMDLVGMASKPMHVRRLQKALQEWVQNPGLFQTPLVPLSNLSAPSAAAAVIRASTSASSIVGGPAGSGGGGINAPPINVPAQILGPQGSRPATTNVNNDPLSLITSSSSNMTASSNSDRILTAASLLRRSVSPPSSVIPMVVDKTAATSSAPHSPSPVGSSISKENPNSQQSGGVPSPTYSQGGQMDYPPLSSSPLQLTPSLVESQIQRIADTAENMIKAMANVEPKALKNNKKVSKEVEMQFQMVLGMPDDEPRKMEEIRRFSAIYGRFDCKRKPEKPLTLHEVSVNEAAAQLTFRKPILLMRRDELFPLARQVVRDSGYQYSKGHSRSQFQAGYPSKIFGLNNQGQEGQRGQGGGGQGKSGDEENSRDSSNGDPQGQNKKRGRYSESEDPAGHMVKKERYERIGEELRQLGDRMEELKQAAGQARDVNDGHRLHAIGQQLEIIQLRQNQLLQEQHHEQQRHLRPRVHGRVSTSSDPERPDTDEDSQLSYSNTSSPNHHMQTSSHGSYVLSASGGQIIAVQNPALSMSLPIRAPSTSPNQSSSSHQIHQDSKNLVNLLNLSRRGGLVNPAAAAAAAAAAIAAASCAARDGSATAANSGNGNKQAVDNYNATISQKKRELATTIIHSDDEEMTFKQEPASPPPPPSGLPSAAISAHSEVSAAHGQMGRTNGK